MLKKKKRTENLIIYTILHKVPVFSQLLYNLFHPHCFSKLTSLIMTVITVLLVAQSLKALQLSQKMFKKLKHKTYSNRRIVSETKTRRKLFPLYITSVLWLKKITYLSCRLSSCQATIVNLLIKKAKTIAPKKKKYRMEINFFF